MGTPDGAVMRVLLSALLDLDLQTFIGGHGYDFRGSPSAEPSGDDGGGGIGMGPILAVLLLTFGTLGLLVWLSPSSAAAKVKTVGRGALVVGVIAVPLIVWAGSSGGDEQSLIVERATSRTGAAEFIVSLVEDDLNTLQTSRGKRAVRVQCLGRDGQVVLDAKRKWPFVDEPGYDYPHAHQPASREQLQQADRCRLRGTRVPLEADVEGALTG
jgi:hypothetical protein